MLKLERYLITILILFCSPLTPCKSQEVTANILRRVFFIQFGKYSGSSFTIEVQSRQYLITARHLVNGIKDGGTIQVFRNHQWNPIKVKPFFPKAPEVDIAVLVLPTQISPSFPLEVSVTGLSLSQNTYFLGFPYGFQWISET